MSQGPYSPIKAAWHLDRMQTLRNGGQCAPVEIQFILSDLCNHDCHFCAYRAEKGLSSEGFADSEGNSNPNRMIPHDKAREILNDAYEMDVQSVIFTGGGEPTVHPHHMELFRDALALGFDCSLNTNGALLRDGWQDILPRFKYVRFSVDAGTPEEYAEIRRVKPSVYNKVLENIILLADEVEARGTDCIVGAGYVVTPSNYVNLIEGVTTLRDTGVRYVRLASMQSTEGYAVYGDKLDRARAMCKSAEEMSGNGFTVVNLFDGVMGVRPDFEFCGFQQMVTYIGGDQKVYRCCYTAYTKLGEIGDLSNQSFTDWFYSSEKKEAIKTFDARSCETCPLIEKNRIIKYMADPDPLHVNFV